MPIAPKPTQEQKTAPKQETAREELGKERQRNRVRFGRDKVHKFEASRAKAHEQDSDDEDKLQRPSSEHRFQKISLEDEAEFGYLGDEDRHKLAAQTARNTMLNGPPAPPLSGQKTHDEHAFQQRRASVFDAIDKLAKQKNGNGGDMFVLSGVAPPKPPSAESASMDVDEKKDPADASMKQDDGFTKPSGLPKRLREVGKHELPRPKKRQTQAAKTSSVPDYMKNPGNYTRYELNWSTNKTNDAEQAEAVAQLRAVTKKKADSGGMDLDEAKADSDHECDPNSVKNMAALAKERFQAATRNPPGDRKRRRRVKKKIHISEDAEDPPQPPPQDAGDLSHPPSNAPRPKKAQQPMLSFEEDD